MEIFFPFFLRFTATPKESKNWLNEPKQKKIQMEDSKNKLLSVRPLTSSLHPADLEFCFTALPLGFLIFETLGAIMSSPCTTTRALKFEPTFHHRTNVLSKL